MEGMFQFPSGPLTTFAQYEASGNRAMPRQAFAEFRGTLGALYVDDASFEVLPERGGRYQDDREFRMEPITQKFSEGYTQHVRDHTGNFLDCMRSRENPTPTWRSATARRAWPSWPTSRWPPSPRSTGIPSASESPTSPRPTISCTTSIASPGRSRTHKDYRDHPPDQRQCRWAAEPFSRTTYNRPPVAASPSKTAYPQISSAQACCCSRPEVCLNRRTPGSVGTCDCACIRFHVLAEQAVQPGHEDVNLGNVRIKIPGRDSRSQRLSRFLLPCQPCVNSDLGFGELTETAFGARNRRHAGFNVIKEL